ncbi:hypothetical protein ACLBXM_05470 [Xanthobacteraceae bacterium A53D]
MRLAVLLAAFIAAPAFALSLPALAQHSSADWTQDPSSGCRFLAPISLTAGPTHWVGTCTDGKASGPGMLRRRDGGKAGFAFYGTLKDGVPVIGVVDLDGGYLAGRFAEGDIGRAKEIPPQERLDAFEAALNAAQAVSASYKAQNNAASARHYEQVAKTLEMQIE